MSLLRKRKLEELDEAKSRKTPKEKVKLYEEGEEKIGRDGKMYVVKIKNGKKKWVRKEIKKAKKKVVKKKVAKKKVAKKKVGKSKK